MQWNNEHMLTDADGNLIPQVWDPSQNKFVPYEAKVQLSGINTELEALMQGLATEGKLEQVRQLLSGVATENKLEQARTLLEAISTKDFATSSKQDALKIAVEDLKSELNLVKSELEAIKANQLSGDQKVQLSGTVAKLIAYDKKMWDEITNYTYGIAGVGSSGIFSAVDAQKDQIMDISEFSEISILIINSLDKALENQTDGLGTSGKVVLSTLPKTHFQTLIPSYRESHMSGEYILLETIPAGARLSLKLADVAPYQSLAVMVRSVQGVSAGSLEIMIGGGLK